MGKLSSAIKAGKSAAELGRNAKGVAGAAAEFRAADKGEMGRQVGRSAFNEGAEVGKTAGKTWLKTFEAIPRAICRSLQFIFALIACGIYGNRVDADRKSDDGHNPEWIFALLVAGSSAITAALFLAATPLSALPIIGSRLKLFKTYRAFIWDMILFVMWLVVFGIFAGIFLKRDNDSHYKGSNIRLMKVGVWLDMMNSLFWLTSGAYGAIKTFVGDKADRLSDKVGNKLFEKKNNGPTKDTGYDSGV